MLATCYAPSGQAYKEERDAFLKQVAEELISQRVRYSIIVGDMNTPMETSALIGCLAPLGWHAPLLVGAHGDEVWTHVQQETTTQIDYAVVSPDLLRDCPVTLVSRLPGLSHGMLTLSQCELVPFGTTHL